jgi:hypothetical protein
MQFVNHPSLSNLVCRIYQAKEQEENAEEWGAVIDCSDLAGAKHGVFTAGHILILFLMELGSR